MDRKKIKGIEINNRNMDEGSIKRIWIRRGRMNAGRIKIIWYEDLKEYRLGEEGMNKRIWMRGRMDEGRLRRGN